MTTKYGISTSKGSSSYNNYVNTPIFGPLNTNKYPGIIPYHSYGMLNGIRPTPPQFFSSQEPIYAEMNTNARQQYLRTAVNKETLEKQIENAKLSKPIAYTSYSSQTRYPTSSHMNYIQPISGGMYVNIKKSNAVGKSGFKVGLPIESPITTKNYYPSGAKSSLRRARSGGSVAPKKKGAIENTSLTNGKICGWGSLPRQNY